MPTLVTGGAGFIGAELVRQMLARGECDVTVFDISPDLGRLRGLAGDVAFCGATWASCRVCWMW